MKLEPRYRNLLRQPVIFTAIQVGVDRALVDVRLEKPTPPILEVCDSPL